MGTQWCLMAAGEARKWCAWGGALGAGAWAVVVLTCPGLLPLSALTACLLHSGSIS